MYIFLPTEHIVAVLFLAAVYIVFKAADADTLSSSRAVSLRISRISRYGRWCKISDKICVAYDTLILARSCASGVRRAGRARDVNLHGAFNATRDTTERDFQVPSYYDVTYRSLE